MSELQQLILFGVLVAGLIGMIWLRLVRAMLAVLDEAEGREP